MRVGNNDGTAFCEIDSLPGCSQIAVSHSAFVKPEARGNGVGGAFHHERLRLMQHNLGYDYAICTVDLANRAQIEILAAENWLTLGSFKSSKTGHFVGIFGKPLDNG
jgi:hypothetical protein